MLNLPAYIDYTTEETRNIVSRPGGYSALTSRSLSDMGTPTGPMTEKTASELINASMTARLMTKKTLEQAVEAVSQLTR